MKTKLNGSALAFGVAVLLFWVSPFTATGFAAESSAAPGDGGAPVTQEQFRQWTDWARKSVQILDHRQKKLEEEQSQQPSGGAQGGGGEVNLENLGTTPGGTSQASATGAPSSGSGLPKMETYFDLNLVNQPGTTENLAFDNYHSFVFFDLNPTPDLSFSFNLLGPGTLPVFYELDYRASNAVTLRAGKIWIPFDDLSQLDPHNIFGGREGIAQLMPSLNGTGLIFLPSVWTELGVGARIMILDTQALQLQTDFTVTNGFGGSNAGDPATGGEYPTFAYTQPPTSAFQGSANSNIDHRNKAIAARAHALFGNTVGFGLSYYTSQWNPDSDSFGHLFLNIIGADTQIQLGGGFELRGGIATQNIQLPEGLAKRGGSYAELGIPLSSKWKLLARGGTLQFDSRVSGLSTNVIGGTILYNPGSVQFSLENSRTITAASSAADFNSYTDLRMIMLF